MFASCGYIFSKLANKKGYSLQINIQKLSKVRQYYLVKNKSPSRVVFQKSSSDILRTVTHHVVHYVLRGWKH